MTYGIFLLTFYFLTSTWIFIDALIINAISKKERRENVSMLRQKQSVSMLLLSVQTSMFITLLISSKITLITMEKIIFLGIPSFNLVLGIYFDYLAFKYGFNTETKTYQFYKPFIIFEIEKLLTEKQIEFKKLEENKLYMPSKNVTITLTGMTKKFTHVIIGEYIGPNKDWIDDLFEEMDKIFKKDVSIKS